jgi:Domain of unknown function (DUF4349)
MEARSVVLFVAALSILSACAKSAPRDLGAEPPGAVAPPGAPAVVAPPTAQPVVAEPTARRVIRTAEVSLEAVEPVAAQRTITQLAEARGGFVLSADTSRVRAEDGAEQTLVTVVFRVPSVAFDATLQTLRGLGSVSTEKVTGQDVTEEYVDLEARLKAEYAVEQQYLAILKDAKAIPDILAVQEKLGEVRTEIERAEGRRRFLDSQTSLSTFTVHLAKHIEAVDASGPGFGTSVRKAGRDAVDVAIAIVNGAIRLVGVLAPIALLLGLPAYLVVRAVVRRRRRSRPVT